jgi:WD40 repeat protein
LFLRLVKIGASSGEDVRRPVPRADLDGGARAAGVLDAYVASRLLTSARDAVQITHEALLTAWPRLRGWLDGDRAGHLIRQDAEDAAAAWDRGGGDSSLLYRGGRLEAAAAWAAGHNRELTPAARRFLTASRQLARRTRVLRLAGGAALIVLTLVASAISVVALHLRGTADQQRATAVQQRDLAVYRQLLAEASQVTVSDPSASAQLLLTAYRMHPSQGLASRLISTENQPLPALITTGISPLYAAAVSPDGRTLAAVDGFGTLRLWNITRPTRPLPVGQPLSIGNLAFDTDVRYLAPQVAFSPDGHTLAAITFSSDSAIRIVLWDITDPTRPREVGHPLPMPASVESTVVFSPDSRALAAISSGGTIFLWDITDRARPRELGHLATGTRNFGYPAAFSPDNRTLAVSNPDGTIGLWNIIHPARPGKLGPFLTTGTSSQVTSVTFSPDGYTLAAGSGDGTIDLYDVTTPASPGLLAELPSAGDDGASPIAFSPDGSTLAAGGYNGTTSLWDVAGPPVLLGQLLASGGISPVVSAAFSQDGRTLAVAGHDGTISVWARPPTTLVASPTGEAAGMGGPGAALSPDGRTLAVSSADGTIGLWSITDPNLPHESILQATGISGAAVMAFSLDSQTLAIGSSSGTIGLWNITDPDRPAPLGQLRASGTPDIQVLAFSRDGRTLAVDGLSDTAAADGFYDRISLWNITHPAHPRELGRPFESGGAASLAFSLDGRTLAAANGIRTSMWTITHPARPVLTGQPPRLPQPNGSSAVSRLEALSPDGRILATVNTDGRMELLSITGHGAPVPVGQPLTTTAGDVSSLAFSPDGHTLAAGGYDGSITLWNITDPDRPALTGQPLATGSTPVASVTLSQDGRTLASDSYDGIIKLWNMDASYAINRICATTSLASQQWRHYIQEIPYNPPCPQ